MSGRAMLAPPGPAAPFPDGPGAYALLIALDDAVSLDGTLLAPAALAPGRYVYCGSARGPGGLKARIGRHLRRGKARRWHVDRLTEAGRIEAAGWRLGGRECDLVTRLMELPGCRVPLAGFGSSDCRRCPAHLLALSDPGAFDSLAGSFDGIWRAETRAGEAVFQAGARVSP